MPQLAEDREEQKYPRWLRYLGMAYVVVLLWATFSLPPTGYDLDSAMLVLLLWLPVLIGLLYITEMPEIVGRHIRAMRVLLTIFTLIAVFWGLVLVYAFIE